MTAEIKSNGKHGGPFLALGVLGLAACVACFIYAAVHASKLRDAGPGSWGYVMAICGLGAFGFGLLLSGLRAVSPNTGKVISLFGDYVGTLKDPGLWWVNPFTKATNISLRTRNMVTPTIKVNDIRGNPIEIAAVVVWRVVDSAAASFDVDDFNSFVDTQCESALRHLASIYPYDTGETHETSLRGSTEEVSRALAAELQERVKRAGVTIEETRLSHLAYAPEIAGAMLRRQQADAVVSARLRIVEGAVGMVESALDHLEKGGKIQLDDERKAAMVSNLMVVLCGDHSAQPVVNTGTLYQG
jgi:hypothetical protein